MLSMHKATCPENDEEAGIKATPCCGCGVSQSAGRQNLDELDFERGIWLAAKDADLEKLRSICGRRGQQDVNAPDSYGYTALHYAARAGHVEVVEELLALGADGTRVTKGGATAAHRASYCGHREIVALITHKCPQCVIMVDDDGDTIAHKAMKGGRLELASSLASQFPELEEITNNHVMRWRDLERRQ